MNENQRVLELLRKAVAILEDETPEPVAPWELGEEETVLDGTIGRPELKTVGDNLPLFTAGLKVIRDHDGRTQWHNIQAWRKTAIWANENLDSGVRVNAIGKFETQTWTGQDGQEKSKTVFSVRLFEAA
jgi:single-stranded DNA-binding protein